MRIILMSVQSELDAVGLRYVHYSLLRHGHESSLLYLPRFCQNNIHQAGKVKEFIRTMNPGLIGMSVVSRDYHSSAWLTSYIKNFNRSLSVLWGGMHPTIAPAECLKYADYVCVGEAERAAVDFANALDNKKDPRSVNNIYYAENGHIRKNPLYPLIENLDEVPSYEHLPANSFVLAGKDIVPLTKRLFKKYDRYSGTIYSTITSRGCPFHCTYCCNNHLTKLYGSAILRKRTMPSIMEELEKAVKDHAEIEYINFQDDCFLTRNSDDLREFCESYKKRIHKPFIARAIPTYISEEKLAVLKGAGLAWLSLGLQSGSDRVCRELYKRNSLRTDFLRAAAMVKKFNIAAFYDVILDNPFEKEADKLKTAHVLAKTPKPFFTQFFSLAFYPGTELYERAKIECPEQIEDYRKKDLLIPRRSTVNSLIMVSTLIEKKYANGLLYLYKHRPHSAQFKIALFLANALCLFIAIPKTSLKVIRLSQRGSLLKTAKTIAIYFVYYVRTRLISIVMVMTQGRGNGLLKRIQLSR